MDDYVNSYIYDQVRHAVHRQWDPIGVAAFSDDMDEYDGYVPALCKLLEEHAGCEKIFEYLWEIETNAMGLSGDRQSTEEFADWLCGLMN